MTLSAQITGAPAGAPSYVWKMSFGGDYWLTVSTTDTASYLTSAAETVSFQVTVSYGSGESATSDAVSVAFVAAAETTQEPAQHEQEQEAETETEKPAKPTGLTVTTVAGWLGALVDWDDMEGADDYLVRWRPAGPNQQLNDGLEPTTSNQAITVDEDGEYVVRVQACNEAGCGAAVAERFTVAPLPPLPPANFVLAAVPGGFEVAASWDAREGATSYQLAWLSLEGTGLAGGSQELTGTSATVEVAGSGEWQFHLQACNEGGCGATLVETVDVANDTAASTSITGPSTPRIHLLTVGGFTGIAGASFSDFDYAHKFTTGPDGYRLTRLIMTLQEKGTTVPAYTIKVCTGTDSNPANDCSAGTLVNPDLSPSAFTFTWTTTGNGITLDASTTYYLVLVSTTAGAGDYQLQATTNTQVTSDSPGWTAATTTLRRTARTAGATWGAVPNSRVWKFGFSGYPRASGAPTLEGLEINGTTLIASFDRDLDASTASAIGHGIKIGSGALQAVTAIHVSGKWLVLTVPAVTQGQTVTATYTKPTSGNKLKDLDGNEVAGFADQAVTNHTGVTPSLRSAVVDGVGVTLTFDRSLKQDSGTPLAQFKYKVDGGAAVGAASEPVIWGNQVHFNTSHTKRVKLADSVTVSYVKPTTNKLQDAWGNDVPALTDQAVENRAPLVTNSSRVFAEYSADAKFNRDQAQSFTTGGHAGGYTLTSIDIELRADTGSNTPTYTVSIHSANSDGTPGTTNHGTLTNPSELVVGRNTFTAPAGGIELKRNTTYFVVVDLTNDGDKFSYETTADDKEETWSSPGWSIGNDRHFKIYNSATWKKNTNTLKMVIRGDYRAAPPADLTAPPAEVLVRNNDQAGGGARNIHTADYDMAQAFTAGTHQHGYVLNSVNLYFYGPGLATPPTFNLKLCTGSASNPISSCDSNHVLTRQGAVLSSVTTFTHSGGGIELTKGTTYYLVLTTTAAGTDVTTISSTNSDNEDFQEIGWSIGDGVLAKGHTETSWTQHTSSWDLRVLGRAKQSGAPTVESLEIDGTKLIATFDRALDSGATPVVGRFGVVVGGSSVTPTAISISGKRVVLTLPNAATSGQTVTASYVAPNTGNKLKDRDGNEVATFEGVAVSNLTGTTVSLSSAEVDGNRMTLTFDRSLKLDSGTNPLAFEYKVGSGNWVSARVDATGISGKQVTYQLRNHQVPRRDQTVLVRYGQPANNKLKDAWDNDAPAFSSATATNTSPLVSNRQHYQAATRSFSASMGSDQAQFFTTGSNSDGYTLTSVDLWLRGEGGSTDPSFTVSIHAADDDSKPTGASLGTLSKPSTLGVGLNTFTAAGDGINLKANTTYVVFVDSTTSPTGLDDYPLSFRVTSSDNEDAGASAGWNIGNARWARPSGDTSYGSTPHGSVLMMVIRGKFGQSGSDTPDTPSALKLVGNIVASVSFADGINRDIQTQFTTGAQSATLTRADVTVNTLGTPPTTYALELWSTGSGAARLATFSPPAALAAGLNTFTLATAQSLAASTTYALVWDQGVASSTFRLGRAGNHNEDSDGLTGWSITNGASRRAHDSTAAFGSPSGGATRFALYGQTGSGAPAAPTGLTATPGDAQVVLTWTDPSDSTISKYQGRQSTDGGATWSAWTDIGGSDATTTSATLTSLINATTYTFEVRWVIGTDNGGAARVSATPAGQLVKNLDKNIGTAAGTNIVANDAAQAFLTGSHDAGFKLSYVILGAGGSGTPPGPSGYSVKVCNNDSSSSPHVPGTTCTELSEPAALAGGGADVFAASAAGIDLSASTTYWVVFDSASGGSGTFDLRRTDDNGEDSGAASGFTINDAGLTRARAVTAWSTAHNPLKLGIFGYAKTGPSAPTGLSAQAGNRQVTLTWTNPNNAEISGYQYRQSADSGATWTDWTDISGSGASTTSHTVGSLSNGQAYTFQVRAVADQGNTPGTASASVSATPSGPPAAPTGLRATPGEAQVKLSWTDPSNTNITKYQVRQRAGNANWSAWTDIASSGATTTTHTVSSLTNATTYTFQIRAVAGSNNGPNSASVSATPAGQLVKNLNKNIGGAAGTNIVANDAAQAFTTGSNGPGYTLNYVVLGAGGSGTPPGPDGYSVKVCNNAATNLPGATCTDLSEPAALAGGGADVFAASGGGIVLSASTTYWIVFDSDSGGSGTWELRRTTDDGEDSGAAAGFGIFNDGLHRARAGTSWATATNDSNPLKLGIFGYARTGPSALSDLAAVVSTGQAALSWTASTFTGVTKYQYRVSNDVGSSWNPDWTDIPGGANATSYTVRNLKSGAIYTIQVRAVAGSLTGAATSVSATLPHLPAPAPSGLKAAPGDAQIELTWTDPSDDNINKYQVRQRAAGGDWTNWADVPSSDDTTTTHTVTGLTNWTRYTVELRAVRGSESSLIATGRPASVSATPNGPLASTIGQTDSGHSTDLSLWDVAQDFTTGSHPHGYTLTDVTISLWVQTGKTPSLAGVIAMICPEATAGGAPDYTDSETHSCLTPALTVPDVTEGTNDLSAGAGGIRLSANTRYFLVLDGNAAVSSTTNLDVTAATGTDAGAAAGWSIGTYSRRNNNNNTWAEVAGERARIAVVGKPTPAPVFGGGGGGGGGGAPARRTAEPSEEDFAWNVTRDIEALDGENEQPTGIWSDGETLWVVENAASGEDRLFAYSLATGERLPEQDLALFNRNRSSNGIWSNDEVVWIADAQQGTLFAYDLATKERLPEKDIELAEVNRQPGGIWVQDGLLLVLNRNPSLFLYDQATGELLDELELDRIINRSPRGIWSDGVTIWVSDDRSDRVLAYRLVEHKVEVEIEPADGAEPDPAAPRAEGQDEPAAAPETKIVIRYELVRHEAEDFGFRTLIAAGNSHPRGIWSDGEVMFVADAQDNRVYSYNLPGAIDARLASLALSDIELDEFPAGSLRYEAKVGGDIEQTTIEATPAHEGATVVIAPADADEDPENGHQVAVREDTQIEITVTSEDESRTRTYTITLERANAAPVATEIPAVELTAGGEAAQLNLADYFSDPDGDPLSYTLGEPSDAEVISAAEADGVLTVTPLSAGTASFDVVASDGKLESEPRTIEVAVETPPVELRLTARRNLADWVELGLQVRAEDGSWQERILPRLRFIPASTELGRWIRSSAIEVGEGAAARTLRIEVRRLAGGWVELALQLRAEDGSWNARSPQSVRVLLAGEAGQWRHGASLSIGSAGVAIAADDGQPPSEPDTPEVDVEPSTAAVEVRLAARPLASGAVEFGLQERDGDGNWRERLLPRLRFLQTDSEVGRWRVSSGIEVGEGDTAGTVRIAARRIANGAVEFALVIRNEDGSWSARLLPRARILRSDSVTGRWRYSTPLGVGSP